MTLHQFIVDQPDIRLDVYLSGNLPELSRASIQAYIRQGLITVNGRHRKPSYRVQTGEQILVESLPEEPPTTLIPENIPLDTVYEDDDLIVINKPAGMTVHPGVGAHSQTLANALAYHFKTLSDLNGPVRPGIVHRLDRDTSGVMVVAKTNTVHQELATQFQERTVSKTYLGLTWGRWKDSQGYIEGPIKRRRSDPTSFCVDMSGKPASTAYQVLESFDVVTLVQFTPHTGRTHQIRVHATSKNHPIVGDDKYDGSLHRLKGFLPEIQQPMKAILRPLKRHFLHAAKLRFLHPHTGLPVEFEVPLPKELDDILDQIREVTSHGT